MSPSSEFFLSGSGSCFFSQAAPALRAQKHAAPDPDPQPCVQGCIVCMYRYLLYIVYFGQQIYLDGQNIFFLCIYCSMHTTYVHISKCMQYNKLRSIRNSQCSALSENVNKCIFNYVLFSLMRVNVSIIR